MGKHTKTPTPLDHQVLNEEKLDWWGGLDGYLKEGPYGSPDWKRTKSKGYIPNYAFSVPSVGLGPVLGTGGAKTVFGVKSLLGSNLDISKIVASTARRNSKVKDEEVLSHVFGDFQDLGALNKRGIPFFPKFHGLANIQGTIPYGGINKTAGLIEKNNIIGTQGFDEILNNAGIDLPTDELYHAEQEILAQSIGRQIGKYGLGAYPRKLVNGRVITGDLKPANLGYRNSNALEAISRGLFQNKLTGSSSILDAQIARVLESGDLTIVDPGGINLNATKRIQVSAGGMIPSNRYTKNLLQGKRGLLSYTTDNVEKQAIINNIRSSLGVEQGGVGKELYPKLFETLKSQGINQVVGSLVNQGRTPKSGDAVDKLKALFPQLTRGRYASKNELNFSDSDYQIPLEGGDKFDGDLKKKAALILKKAAISSSFGYRSYLNKGLVPNYAYIPLLTPALGRILTNTISPYGYSVEAKMSQFKTAKPKDIFNALVFDKPSPYIKQAMMNDAAVTQRDFPFRKMFGLKPRFNSDSFIQNKDKTYSFNQKSMGGRDLINEAQSQIGDAIFNQEKHATGHSIMGGFDFNVLENGSYDFSDRWDVGLNKGEKFPGIIKGVKDIIAHYKDKESLGWINKNDQFKPGSLFLRKIINAVTTPITIRGNTNIDGYISNGLVPNFNALTSAIQREIKAGIPASQIRIGASSRIAGLSNPLGLGVYNTKDEPLGLNQGINRVAAMGLDPKKAGIPNYAKGDEFFGGIIGVGDNVRNRLDLSNLNADIKKYQKQVRLGQRSQEELDEVINSLKDEFLLSQNAVSRLRRSFDALAKPTLASRQNLQSQYRLVGAESIETNLPFPNNQPDIFGYSSGDQLPLSAGKINPNLSPELRKQALAAGLARNKARLGGSTNVQYVGERPAFNDPRAIENYRKEYTESLSKTQSEVSRVQNEAERQVAADAEREILQQESLIKKSRQIERNTSRFDKLFGNTGLLEINKYRKALKFADENGLEASKRQLKERLSQRALTSSFVIPALGGIAEQGVTSLFGDDSRAARGASRATGGLANVASFAATGFGISGGNPIGAVAGAGVGLLTELPSVIKSFTDTLPDLVKNLEKLRTESNKTNNAFNTFLSSTQKLISIDSGESRATVGQRRTIERERTLSLASIPSAARSQIKEAAEKGDIAKVADISSRYARLSEQKSIFSQDIIALSQAENKNKFGFRDRFNTAYSSVGGGKESGLLFNALAANSAFFTSGASYLGTPRKEGSGRAIGEAIESSKRLRDFENTQELDNLVKPVIQSTLQFANKSGKTFSESLTDQDIADLNGSRGRGIDAFINAFAGKLRSKGIDSKDFEKDIRNAPAEVQESFARGSGKLITRKSIDDTARESEVIRKATAEFSFSLASLSESILNSSIKAKEAATAFEIDVSRKFAKAATGIEIGRIRRDASSETSLIGLGNNEFLKASLDGSNDLADAKSNFNLSRRRIEGQKLVQTRNFLTTQKDDFQESVRSAVSSDPTIAKNPDDYNKAVGRNINFLDEVFNANNPQSAIAKAREKLRELEVNSKSEKCNG